MQLKLRYGDFRTITRSHTLAEPTDLAARDRANRGCELLRRVDLGDGIRLLGVTVQQLEDAAAVQATASPLDDSCRCARSMAAPTIEARRTGSGGVSSDVVDAVRDRVSATTPACAARVRATGAATRRPSGQLDERGK